MTHNFCPSCNKLITFLGDKQSAAQTEALYPAGCGGGDSLVRCPVCGFTIERSFYATQEVEILIAVQGASSLSEAMKLRKERRNTLLVSNPNKE